MSDTVSQAALLTALNNSLSADTQAIVTEHGDSDLILENAARRLARVIALRRRGVITLQADVAEYDAPSDFLVFTYSDWGVSGQREYMPWEDAYPDELPSVSSFEDGTTTKLLLAPAPTAGQITQFGTQYRFGYRATHTLDDSTSTIPVQLQDLFVLIAQIEALQLVAKRNSGKPVALRDGYSGTPRNGTPAALAAQLEESLQAQLSEHRRAA